MSQWRGGTAVMPSPLEALVTRGVLVETVPSDPEGSHGQCLGTGLEMQYSHGLGVCGAV
eukprot:CAMPEP_0204293226 /NCGR_PEP_ID=MMETSP0468-20130131/65741_1 /ASSEMBLY_ACC=CAM_ASM_000383 /TAXON_ID=2969 /ORGANISM="Oxyrrhis marina" /LENGTH=58 /DNA_ID=CAMNT_0051271681 /DNA_START=99 /DNA_END=272 /DNA_ORIENTATION=-